MAILRSKEIWEMELEDIQEKLIELYKIQIEKGLVRFLDYLNIVNNYAQTKNNLTTAEMSRLQIINQMNYLK